MPGVSPTAYYIGLIVLAVASLAGVYLHVLPDTSLFIAIVSFLIGSGHGASVVTLSQNSESKKT